MAEDTRQDADTPKDFGADEAAKVSRWLAEIKAYDKTFDGWHTRVPKILKRYRDEKQDGEDGGSVLAKAGTRRFNILWSNIKTLQPSLYSKTPVPEVARRWKDRDPVGRAAAEVLERSLAFAVDAYDFDGTIKEARDDYLLAGRGQAWVRYIPTYGAETRDRIALNVAVPEGQQEPVYSDPEGKAVTEPLFGDDGQPYMDSEPYRPVLYEQTLCDFVNWRDFGHTAAATWEKVGAVWKREMMTRNQLVERFGKKIGGAVPLAHKDKNVEDSAVEQHQVFKRALVYEVWDKDARKVFWICPDYRTAPLDEMDDPLGLEGFFPCPKPLYATTTTDSLVPVPDYTEYQTQADELDGLTERIDLLTQALRVAGAYNGEYGELERLISSQAENVLVPIEGANWALFAQNGGVDGAISWVPIEQVAKVLAGLIEARERVKQDLYEITGLSDIMRGQVDPREKLGQSRLKGQFASLRIRERQDDVARFVRDIMRIKAEIMAEKFAPETLLAISGYDRTVGADPGVYQQAVALLKDDKLRQFRIDIETDSTVLEDRQAEQQARTEFLGAVTPFLQQAIPAAQQYPELKDMLAEMLLFGVRGFRAGRHLESVFEETIDTMRDTPQQQNQPDPAMMAQAENEKQKIQFEHEREMKRLDMEHQAAMAKVEVEKTQAQRPDTVVQFSAQQEQQVGSALVQMAAQQAETLTAALQAMQQGQQVMAAMLERLGAPRVTELIRDGQGRPERAVSRLASLN